jgi:putative ABC transport system permease protein
MEKLFGIPLDALTVFMLIIFGLCVLALTISALRNRVMFKIAARNLPRRPAQTALIIMGLMLAATLFSASFTTGDTLSYSIRATAVRILGEVDIVVYSDLEDATGRSSYFDEGQVATVRDSLSDSSEVEGTGPAILEMAPVESQSTSQQEPQVDLIGVDPEWADSHAPILDDGGQTLSLGNLGADEVYVIKELAEDLEVAAGDVIHVHLGYEPTAFTVADVYAEGGGPALTDKLIVMPLANLQTLLVENGAIQEGQINMILITNRGGPVGGAAHSDKVMNVLEPDLEDTGLKADAVKKDVLEVADEAGEFFGMIFMLFGSFSIIAGILLLFLIFVMLAAERKRQLGIARAVGTQRSQVVRMFTFEGVLYALVAAAIGSALGIVVGWAMIQVMAVAFGEVDFELVHHFVPRSLLLAYLMGVVLTVVVVAASAWWVSRLNIVRAIRDIPDPPRTGRWWNVAMLVLGIVIPILGLEALVLGIVVKQAGFYMTGLSLIIIGLSLLARRLGAPDRAAYSIAGVLLVALWLLPQDVHSNFVELNQGLDLFIQSGVLLVLGAVWVLMYNSDILLGIITRVFGGIRSITPILKTAVSYPMASRFRTGMALTMFAMIVFTLVVMSVINGSFRSLLDDPDRLSGGFQIVATTSYLNPIEDMEAAIGENAEDGVDPADIEAIAGLTNAEFEALYEKETGESEWTDLFFEGVDAGYTENVSYDFAMMTDDFDSPGEVWQALTENTGMVVLSSYLVPSRISYNLSFGAPSFRVGEGDFVLEDEVLPDDVYIDVRHPVTLQEQHLHVIGVLDGASFGAPVTTSQETLNTLVPEPMPPFTHMFKVSPDVEDVGQLAKDLEAQFFANGMDATVTADEIEKQSRANEMMNNVMSGFMGLGLIVGIAALGVIAARSVVERRQQIGMLRAVGFQRSMVQASFLLEFSFISLLGIGLGVVLGLAIGAQVINDMSTTVSGLQLIVPWVQIVSIVVIAYVAAFITTYLPARQAARVYPADALRYE